MTDSTNSNNKENNTDSSTADFHQDHHHHHHEKDEIPLSLAKALATGIITAVVFTAIGFLWYIIANIKYLSKGSYKHLDNANLVKSIEPKLFIHNLIHFNALGVVGLGLYFLILTPFLRVVASVYQFLMVKDRAFSIITGTVASLLILGFILGVLNLSI